MPILSAKLVNMGAFLMLLWGTEEFLRKIQGSFRSNWDFFFALLRSGARFSIVVLSVHLLPAFVGAIVATHGVDTVAMKAHNNDRTTLPSPFLTEF